MSEKSRLRWLCRRGMKELDVVMTGYLESQYEQASEAEKKAFITLLEMHDPDLYALLMRRQSSPNETIETVVGSIRDTFRNSLPILK
jgi:antitoxin CptB